MAQQQQGQQPAFPVSGRQDEDMVPADVAPGLGAGGGDSGGRHDPMADLETALGLAAAWFDGDESVARWVAGRDGAGSSPHSPSGVVPADDPFDAWGAGDAGWLGHDDAAQDAMLGLDPSLGTPSDLLGLGLGQDAVQVLGNQGPDGPDSEASTGDSSLLGGDSAARPPSAQTPGEQPPAAGRAAASSQDAASDASAVAQGLGSLHLGADDIDMEPGDVAAAGADQLSLEAALAGDPAGAAGASEPAPPPIVPVPTDMRAAEEDPLGALEAAIEADKPKFRPDPEWVKMMQAVEGELEQAAEQGAPTLVDSTAPAAGERAEQVQQLAATAAAEAAAGAALDAAASMQGVEVQRAQRAGQLPREEMAGAAEQDAGLDVAMAAPPTTAADAQPALAEGAWQGAPLATQMDQERKRAFALLQPICSVLLLQRGEPQRMAELLTALEAALGEVSEPGLQQCMDYVLFPLLMMLDAAAALHQARGRADSQQAGAAPEGEAGALMALPAMASDRATEAVLGCVRVVLRRCVFQAGEGLLGMLRRLAAMLALPQGVASEEMHEQVLLCLEAAVAGAVRRDAPPPLRAALLGEDAAPLLGYLSSLLLQMAEAEAQRGSSGSRTIRDASLATLLALLSAVAGSEQAADAMAAPASPAAPAVTEAEAQAAADALAFFLPGVAVGLCKALLLSASSSGGAGSGRGVTGPAASSAAAVSAVRALAVLLVACLGDKAVEAALHSAQPGPGGARSADSNAAWGQLLQSGADVEVADSEQAGGDSQSLKHALLQLRALSQRPRDSGQQQHQAGEPQQVQQQQGQPPHAAQPGHMRVERTAAWVQGSAERLHQLLSTALPPLLGHQRPTVREALVQAVCNVLDGCSMALQPRTQEALLQLLLSAAQDEWQQVSVPARLWLQQHAEALAKQSAPAASATVGGGATTAFAAASERLLLQLLEGLPGALRSGDAVGRRHAQQLASAIQVCPPGWFASSVVHHPVRLQQLVASFLEAFAFDPSIAGMLLYAGVPPAGAATSYAGPAAAASSSSSADSLSGNEAQGAASSSTGQSADDEAKHAQRHLAGADAGRGSAGSVVLLPRMPLGLVLITTTATYEAVATALRAAAALAAAADALPGSDGTALRRLVDGFLGRLQVLVEAGVPGSVSGSRASKQGRRARLQQPGAGGVMPSQEADTLVVGRAPWQLQAASAVAALAELLFGASPAWQPSWCFEGGKGPAGSNDSSGKELEFLAAAVVQELVQDAIWSLPTSAQQEEQGLAAAAEAVTTPELPGTLSGGGGSLQQERLTTQQMGCNALLLKAALECCGAAARGLGPRFATNGRLLRHALLPMLDKLADSTQLVVASAHTAVRSVCWWCGYGGSLRRLVAANADYIVDGMCAQLRQLDRHPRAPQLFTALLQQAGIAPELLPLLAEPARSAIQGLGVLARRQQPQHVLAFLQTLSPVAAAAEAVARQVLAEMKQAAEEVQQRWAARKRELDEAEAATAIVAGGTVAATQAEIRRFFEARQWQREDERHPSLAAEAENDAAEDARKVLLSGTEREHIALLRRHAHVAGSLAQAVADAVSPLVVAQSLQVAVQSFGVCIEALRAMAATTEAVELDTDKIQVLTRRRTDMAGPDPDTPRMLPSAHLAWTPLMSALQDWRVSVIETALQFLADCTCLAGSFFRKRFSQEAVPCLQRLLHEGPACRNIIAPGQDDTTSPATVQRAQLAVLRCLHQIASCRQQLAIGGVSNNVADALLPSVHTLLVAVADMMGSQYAAPVREQATQAYMALASVDPDATWCQLSAALYATTLDSSAITTTDHAPTLHPSTPRMMRLPGNNQVLAFPPCSVIVRPLFSAASVRTTAGLANRQAMRSNQELTVPHGLSECGAAKLNAMRQHVEQLQSRWHEQVDIMPNQN